MTVMRRLLPTRFELAALVMAACIGCFQLLVPPIVGRADNGDGYRLMQPLGLDYPSDVYTERYWYFINESYKFSEHAGPALPLVTSEFLPLRAALLLAKAAPRNGRFDIRFVGGVQLCLFLLSLWLVLVSARGLGLVARLGLAAALTFICTDAGYVAYFNSFFCESIAYISLLATVALSLLILGGRTPAVPVLAGYCLSASLLICAKPQYAALGPLLALLGWFLSRQIAGSYRAVAGGAAAALLLVVSVWYFLAAPAWLANTASYNVVFFEILKNSPVPERDAAEFGLGPWAVKYAGTNAFMAKTAWQDSGYNPARWARVNSIAIARFYLRHPGRLLAVTNKRAARAFELVLPNSDNYPQGNYPQSAGLPPGQHARSFTYWNSLRSSVVPHSLLFLCIYVLVNGAFATVFWLWGPGSAKRVALLQGVLILILVIQFLTVSVMDAEIDVERHLLIFNAAFDLSLLLLAVAAIHYVGRPGLHLAPRVQPATAAESHIHGVDAGSGALPSTGRRKHR